jgi:6-phosphofructokinase
VTLEASDHLRTTGSSHNRAFLVETMGSDCGYLAMMAGLAGGAEVISTPEFEVSRQDSCNCGDCRRRHKENANKILAYFDADKQRTGFELRTPTLGHVVREAPPSAFDRLLAARLGVGAVKSFTATHTAKNDRADRIRGMVFSFIRWSRAWSSGVMCHVSNAKMRLLSFFMLTTVQLFALASSISDWVNVPTLVSGRPPAGPAASAPPCRS